MRIKNILCGFALGAMLIGMVSCSEDEHYDVVGNPNNMVYFNAGIDNSKTVKVVKTTKGALSDLSVKLPVKILRPASSNITVTATADTSLVSVYNDGHGTSFKALPLSMLKSTGMTATINQGETAASDSVTVEIDKASFAQLTDTAYVLPLRLTQAGADISGERGTAWIVIKIEERYINYNAAEADMQGELVSDYSSWKATYDNGTVIETAQLFDGDLTNGPQLRNDGADGKSTTVVVDMHADQQVTGIRLSRYYDGYYPYYFSNVEMSVSNDGTTWTLLGQANEDQMEADKGYQYISLYAPITARYLKLNILSGYSSVSSLAELGVYVK